MLAPGLLSLLLALASALPGQVVDSHPTADANLTAASCSGQSSCAACLGVSGCLWCPSQAACIPTGSFCELGETTGPAITSSSLCFCANPTATYTTCAECEQYYSPCPGFLGWCPSEGKCYWGTNGTSPLNHTCVATETQGIYVTAGNGATALQRCACINPTASLTTCAQCEENYSICAGYLGWCPFEGKCYWGVNASSPLGHQCVATETNGQYLTTATHCVCENPTASFDNCSSCEENYSLCPGYLGWCQSENKCYFGSNASSPLNHACVSTSPDTGTYTNNCACTEPILIGTEATCEETCGYTWCEYQEYCQLTVGGVDPCPAADCETNCLCLPGSNSTCDLCQPGYSNISVACTYSCAPNCFDCLIDDYSVCQTQCAVGFTGFPECVDFCPPQCLHCGGAALNSTLTRDECLWCSDRGAAPPYCKECLPSLCRSAAGTCSVPCNSNGGSEISEYAPDSDDANYGNCDACTEAAEKWAGALELLAKTWLDSPAVAEAISASLTACLETPPPFDLICGFTYLAVAAGEKLTEKYFIASWAGGAIADKLISEGVCISARQCPYPCTADRSDKLVAIEPER